MYWKHLVSVVLVLLWCMTIVHCRYDADEDASEKIFNERDFLANSRQKQQLRNDAWARELINKRRVIDPWTVKDQALRAYEDMARSNKMDNSRRSQSQRLDVESRGIDYERPIENSECGRQQVAPEFRGRIVGGHEAVPHSWPWQVLYQQLSTCSNGGGQCIGSCGGTLIKENFVLTAAHCVHAGEPETITIVAGIHNKGNTDEKANRWQVRKVAQVIVHEDWNSNTVENDIALLRLAEPVAFNEYVQPACLPGPDPKPDSQVVLLGWGRVSTNGQTSPVLKQTQVHVVDNCTSHWRTVNDEKQLCFKDKTLTSSACKGDSGGPALQQHDGQWVVEGVTSFGNRICEVVNHGIPAVYTRVSAYLPWIHSNIDQ